MTDDVSTSLEDWFMSNRGRYQRDPVRHAGLFNSGQRQMVQRGTWERNQRIAEMCRSQTLVAVGREVGLTPKTVKLIRDKVARINATHI